ncbi:TECT3 protein, partial [Todus mexicanus]|nr:TECT3 protein [Todus mexicanus]
KLNYFQQPQDIKESDFWKFLEKYGSYSFSAPSQAQPPISAFYRAGDPILIYFDSSSVLSTLRQPVKMGASGLCVDGNPAGFLDSKSTSCTRIFANLSKSCVTDPALDAASYYRDFTVLKVPVNDTILQSMKVIYEIEFSGTHGIQSVSVQFKVSNISGNTGSSLQQRFTLHFWVSVPICPGLLRSLTLSHTLPRSGNPGWIAGSPLLIADSGAVHHAPFFCYQDADGFFFFPLSWKSLCQSCYFLICSLSPTLEERNCSYIQQKFYRALHGMKRAENLAITGSASSAQAEEWTTVLSQNCSGQAVNCASCCVVPVALEIQILWTKVGLLSNPQAQILGARYSYHCHALKFPSTSTVPLTTAVTFTDMTEWPEPPRGQPQTHWKLPFDIFFPFKMALNMERSYGGDLAVCFWLILIIFSVLCS